MRGVLQETKQLQIIRLTQRDGSFSAHLVPADVLTNALSRPTLRAETVLDDLSDRLDRMRRLKRGGISKLPSDVADPLDSLSAALNKIGIFLVPVGELEEWLATESIAASKRNKWAWANEAALTIQTKGPAEGDIWDFVRAVANYLGK